MSPAPIGIPGINDCEPGQPQHCDVQRSFSNPAINNYFDNKDQSISAHVAHDRDTAKTLAHLTETDPLGQEQSMQVLDDEVCKVARRLELLAASQRRKISKKSAQQAPSEHPYSEESESSYQHWGVPVVIALVSICLIALCVVWNDSGTLHHSLGIEHVHSLRSRHGYVKSPLYIASGLPGNNIELRGQNHHVFDIRIVVMAGQVQKLKVVEDNSSDDMLKNESSEISSGNGVLHYELLADGRVFHSNQIEVKGDTEVEFFETVDVEEKARTKPDRFHLHAWAETPDGQPVAFLCQVMQMGAMARYRFYIGAGIFVITFGFIMTEVIHRVYSALIGTMVMHFVTAYIQEAPRLRELITTIDFATLMLLFSMMILMHMLSLTGFFEWFTIKLVGMSKRNPVVLFFVLSNAAGVLSAFLDNVTVTLLTGPLAYSLAEKTGLKAMPLYLAITIAASVGGTATMIGDPPNIVIGSKMGVGFEQFLLYNGPLTLLMLPLSVLVLYYLFKDDLVDASKLKDGLFDVDMKKLTEENEITDMDTFRGISAILAGVLLLLLTQPLHNIEPAWFTVMGMFLAAIMYHRHHIEDLLLAVEWDTLLFFLIVFVLVESMQELGVIHQFGDWLVDAMLAVPEGGRMLFALALFIWLSSIGSAFLESLPYTTAIISLLLDLRNRDLPGMDVNALTWSLSVGACIGGIGSVMGSSTNQTAIAISERYGKHPEDRVTGRHFLRYGFPLLVLLTTMAMFYHWFIFVGLGIKA